MEDLQTKLLAVTPKDEQMYHLISNAKQPIEIIRATIDLFGIDKKTWPSWLIDMERIFVEQNISIVVKNTGSGRIGQVRDIKLWLIDSVGTKFDGDGINGAQCKDYVNAYAEWLGHPLKPSNAAETWDIEQDKFWQKVPYEANKPPTMGDIVIWAPWKDNQYGHIAVVLSAEENEFQSVDQNWDNSSSTLGSPVAVVSHNYTSPSVLGYLRPTLEDTQLLQ